MMYGPCKLETLRLRDIFCDRMEKAELGSDRSVLSVRGVSAWMGTVPGVSFPLDQLLGNLALFAVARSVRVLHWISLFLPPYGHSDAHSESFQLLLRYQDPPVTAICSSNPLAAGFLTHKAIFVSISDVRIAGSATEQFFLSNRFFGRGPSEQSWTLAHFDTDWHGEIAHALAHRDMRFSAARLEPVPTARQPDEQQQPTKRGACSMTRMDPGF